MVLIKAIDLFFQFIYLLIVARVFLSWLPSSANTSIGRFIFQVTEPILEPFRALFSRFIPKGPGLYLDFSPVVALLVLEILRRLLMSFFMRMMF